MKNIILAYVDGVNAYIRQLSPEDYPIEFKFFDYKPELWKPVNCALVMQFMTESLTGGSSDLAMSNVRKQLGEGIAGNLFPDNEANNPIIPRGTKWDYIKGPISHSPQVFITHMSDTLRLKEGREGVGSNNWVVAGSKTATGFPLLANDPHLQLTFPSIWYQVQTVSPGVNVYGVSVPGAPCVTIGFNKQIGWGLTNTGADVMDWYGISFKDGQRKEYLEQNKWMPVTRKIEVIKVRNKAAVVDTVLYTGYGPVVYQTADHNAYLRKSENVPVGHALRWIGHEANWNIKALYFLNRARNYQEYRNALQYYTAPAQNFVFAGNDSSIAITVSGKLPVKYFDQGKYILNGADANDRWHGWIPVGELPASINPGQGFLYSANQSPADSSYPYYLNWSFASDDRARRIEDRLSNMRNASVDSMRMLQNDTYSMLAGDILDTLLKEIDTLQLNTFEKQMLKELHTWDKRFDAEVVSATLFNEWWNQLFKTIWSDRFDRKDLYLKWPSNKRTVKLLLDEPTSSEFDDTRTEAVETRRQQISNSFHLATAELTRRFSSNTKQWQWGKYKKTRIAHLSGLSALGSGIFSVGGSSLTVNALSDNFGPSWRMVLQFGQRIKAFGILPGGQSGNPGSKYYDDQFKDWERGNLRPLLFLYSQAELPEETITTLTLKN